MSIRSILAATFVAAAQGTTLTGATFKESIEGKNAFVKFYAPWCGHCKRLAPAWDQLGGEFAGNSAVVIGDVDCTDAESKALCAEYGVRGYPTLKYFIGGEPNDYKGGRDFDALLSFAKEKLTAE
jgi:protein disulfide-isomerase-like protein